MSDFLQVAQNFGVTLACLVVLSLAVWRALVFVGTNVLKPLVERHISFLDKVQVVIEKQGMVVDHLLNDHQEISEQLDTVVEKLDHITHEIVEVKSLILEAEKPIANKK